MQYPWLPDSILRVLREAGDFISIADICFAIHGDTTHGHRSYIRVLLKRLIFNGAVIERKKVKRFDGPVPRFVFVYKLVR